MSKTCAKCFYYRAEILHDRRKSMNTKTIVLVKQKNGFCLYNPPTCGETPKTHEDKVCSKFEKAK